MPMRNLIKDIPRLWLYLHTAFSGKRYFCLISITLNIIAPIRKNANEIQNTMRFSFQTGAGSCTEKCFNIKQPNDNTER